jgi:propanol-preferring alcohol dehydrogenase
MENFRKMKAMVLNSITDIVQNSKPLVLEDTAVPSVLGTDILIQVSTCGVCHTELDEIEGRAHPVLPIIPGHQVIGRVFKMGEHAHRFKTGDRVGAAWIHSSCMVCEFCLSGFENLCSQFKATGLDADGGYAEFMKIDQDFAFHIPEIFSDEEAAPLLCAGAIGYRSLKLTGIENGMSLGLVGFGGSGHLVLKLGLHLYPESRFYIFSRTPSERDLAMQIGATWSGEIYQTPPELLNAVIDTTPVWDPILAALKMLKPGGRLVINAIRKEDHDKNELLHLDYARDLWLEKEIKSVANVTRRDVEEFLAIAARVPIKPEFQTYKLEQANLALMELKTRKIRGAKVLKIGHIQHI